MTLVYFGRPWVPRPLGTSGLTKGRGEGCDVGVGVMTGVPYTSKCFVFVVTDSCVSNISVNYKILDLIINYILSNYEIK